MMEMGLHESFYHELKNFTWMTWNFSQKHGGKKRPRTETRRRGTEERKPRAFSPLRQRQQNVYNPVKHSLLFFINI